MKKEEFLEKIKSINNIEKRNDRQFEGLNEYYLDKEQLTIYGLQVKKGLVIAFFKDLEREKTKELGEFENEEQAYDSLYDAMIK